MKIATGLGFCGGEVLDNSLSYCARFRKWQRYSPTIPSFGG